MKAIVYYLPSSATSAKVIFSEIEALPILNHLTPNNKHFGYYLPYSQLI